VPFAEHNNMVKTIPSDRNPYINRNEIVGTTNKSIDAMAQKGLPALRRWLPSPRHVFCHGGLPDIDAKLEQFANAGIRGSVI